MAHRRLPRIGKSGQRGLLFAVLAGCLMGFLYPQLARSISPAFVSGQIEVGMLTPYSALLLFAVGLVVSNLLINSVFMRVGNLSYADYFRGSSRVHAAGIAGGTIWLLALAFNLLAAGVAGPAVAGIILIGAATL